MLVFVLMITMRRSEDSTTDISLEKNFPSVEDVAQRFDENGYEWIATQDGTNFYRPIGSQADWTEWKN